MKVGATIMNDQILILLLNWVILPPESECTPLRGIGEAILGKLRFPRSFFALLIMTLD